MQSHITEHSDPVVNALRAEAVEVFTRKGFPTSHDERYRYTAVGEAFAPNYGFQLMSGNTGSSPQVPDCFGTLADVHADPLVALNTMLTQDVLVVRVPARELRSHPLQISNIARATAPLLQVRRILIIVEPEAHVQIILSDKAEADQDFLTSQVTELFVGQGADVELYDMEETHARYRRFHHLFADVAANARLTHTVATLDCGLTRNQTDVRLSGEGAHATLLGCAVADASQHVANDTLIHHVAPGCESNELYKYVVDENATAAFAGRILVAQDAQQTVSNERNANLVCAPTAHMWTQPMLEIYADDVQCSHGATVGQLNDDALFYMRQRGISADEARTLLKQAFAAEVIAQVPLAALRPRLTHLIDKRFRECENCRLCK